MQAALWCRFGSTTTGAYRVLVDARDWRSGFISRADVADFLVKQVNDDSFTRRQR